MPWEERELEKRAPDGFPHLQKAPLKKAPLFAFYLLRYPIFTIKKYTIGARSSLYTAKGRRVMRPTRAMNVLMASQPKMKAKNSPAANSGISSAVKRGHVFRRS